MQCYLIDKTAPKATGAVLSGENGGAAPDYAVPGTRFSYCVKFDEKVNVTQSGTAVVALNDAQYTSNNAVVEQKTDGTTEILYSFVLPQTASGETLNRDGTVDLQAINGLSATDEGGHEMGSTGTRWKTFFANSGAEANEGAIKLARRWGETNLDGASTIVTARKSFHGRTLATLAATGQDKFHKSFRPLPEGFVSVPLNDIYTLRERVERGGICAIMLECVQGEGGVWNANYDYLRDVRDLCTEKGLLLIIDEVQTGFYRCGSPFCFQRSGIEPDVVAMAKGIADGFPMGAVAARAEVADLLRPGDHGSTFGGNALACAVGLACVNALAEGEMGEHVLSVGRHLRHRLTAMPHVSEVRGHGLMRGAQLDVPIATQVVEEGLAEGLVMNHVGDSILRFLPPLVITREEVDEACDRLEALISRLA